MSTNVPARAYTALAFPSLTDPAREKVAAEARIAGHASGYAAGLATARAQLTADRAALVLAREEERRTAAARLDYQVSVLNDASTALHLKAAPVLAELTHQLVAGALDIAQALLGAELAVGDISARTALARALEGAEGLEAHTIRLNPGDLAVLDQDTRNALEVTLAPDPSLARGDAVAEYPHGLLDARLGTAIDRARNALKEVAP